MAASLLRRNPRFTSIPLSLRFSTLSTPSPSNPRSPSSLDSISRVKSAIRSELDPDRIATLFESSSHEPSFYGDRLIYSIAVRKLWRSRRPDLIRRVLDHQLSHPSTPKSEAFFVRSLLLFSETGLLDDAVATFHRIPSPRTDRSFSALLSAFLDNQQVQRLRESFISIPKELGVSPGVSSYNVLIKSHCVDGDLSAARQVLDEMRERGINPNIVSYNTLLDGFSKKGDAFGFEEILGEIKSRGLDFNLVTYNCRLSALCAQGKSSEAEELLDVMASKGLKPNRISLDAVIDGFCKEGDVKSALRVFTRMRSGKKENEAGDEAGGENDIVLLSSKTYSKLIRSLVQKEELELALDISKECLEKKWAPPFDAMKGLVDGLVKNSQIDLAKGILKKMRKGLRGDAIDAWKKVEGALQL
ncbi:Cobalamin (vitamin B12)-binding module cap domain-containing protein [Dioscorea alata]|uniref:Cobalamin (Vitamin B12)-binding module cap domain-containing protein n=2 Tax=Dioscorea alata TaxID=55571 RepID=A0ACB7WUL6_DIOAL|nr:Cobalamin (vitamin B12)-binding module cap domain-containing protein [Dioscorea alata]KAH7692155.1 Cobalamin (vitamin B12)-binding module cap domain-containing protein [Dioscorea alata]